MALHLVGVEQIADETFVPSLSMAGPRHYCGPSCADACPGSRDCIHRISVKQFNAARGGAVQPDLDSEDERRSRRGAWAALLVEVDDRPLLALARCGTSACMRSVGALNSPPWDRRRCLSETLGRLVDGGGGVVHENVQAVQAVDGPGTSRDWVLVVTEVGADDETTRPQSPGWRSPSRPGSPRFFDAADTAATMATSPRPPPLTRPPPRSPGWPRATRARSTAEPPVTGSGSFDHVRLNGADRRWPQSASRRQ